VTGQLSCTPKNHKMTRHSAMTTAAALQLLQPLQMNNNDHRHRYVIVLYCIVWFDQKKWFIRLLQWQMTSGCMSCWQLTRQVIVMWNALWYVLQCYHSLTYIDYECRKYLMHLVLLYINKLMVCIFESLQCAFVYNWIERPHSYNATLLLYPF
jgi:hypothetical protein